MIPDKPAPDKERSQIIMVMFKLLTQMMSRKDNKDWLRYMKDHPYIALLMSWGDNFASFAKFAFAVLMAAALPFAWYYAVHLFK